ncbi:O-antigen ligase family protein [Palleronia abyssalis]|uniref:O-antigen ligase-related domain-containing protein n=1 Tax=Palleronia abyssalis TaxID=1501240 RepID=A0A2R8BTK3_9RHOB|nr:O-antigen ligase family protein [Palleronia abyssalis]SPJ23492.1 hypothetical protein PAA8504_01303 [Palleronia abyssalis]
MTEYGVRGKWIGLSIILASLFLPTHFEVASIRFTPSLVVLIFAAPFAAGLFFAQRQRIRLPDVLIMAFVCWQGLTIAMNNPGRFVEFTGQQTLMTLGGYLIGRTMIRDARDLAALIRIGGAIVVFSLPFALYEALTDDPIVLLWIDQYTGFDTFIPNDYEPRLGLHRAQWVFTHPIHYGLLGAFFLPLVVLGLRGADRPVFRMSCGLLIFSACVLSVSSGAILAAFLQAGVYIWYRLAKLFGPPWRIVLATGAVLYVVLEAITTKSAFFAISGRLAINPQTAHYRTLIWDYGSAQVVRTPIFGNGYNYWPRPHWMVSSVDNYWLQQAMVHGVPAVACVAGALVYAVVAVNRGQDNDAMRLAWTLFLIGFAMSAATVAIWGEIQTLFMILFGAGLWMLPRKAIAPNVRTPRPFSRNIAPRLTRFPAGQTGSTA